MNTDIQHVALLVILAGAVATDLRWRKIPNWLSGLGVLSGMLFHSMTNGLPGFTFSLKGAALGLCLLLIWYLCGWMGAGDVKLYAAVGSFLGPVQTLSAAVVIALVGGLLAVLALGVHQGWKRMGVWLWSVVQTIFWARSLQPVVPADNSPKLPYAVAISIGTAWSFWWSPLG